MDMLDDDLLAFWRKLNEHKVRYIMIGGFAVNMHGYARATKDADLWLEDSIESRLGLRKTFAALGYGDFASVEEMVFVPGWTTFYVGGIELDIMTRVKGLDEIGFKECFEFASIADLDGIKVPFLHINHLMQAKEASGRPQDLLDLEKLRTILDLRNK
jgi:predicted nucleotidyltransferase